MQRPLDAHGQRQHGTHTQSDAAGGNRTRAGFCLVVDYEAEAEVAHNKLGENPAAVGVFLGSWVTRLDD
jgi:hypothetical protein